MHSSPQIIVMQLLILYSVCFTFICFSLINPQLTYFTNECIFRNILRCICEYVLTENIREENIVVNVTKTLKESEKRLRTFENFLKCAKSEREMFAFCVHVKIWLSSDTIVSSGPETLCRFSD